MSFATGPFTTSLPPYTPPASSAGGGGGVFAAAAAVGASSAAASSSSSTRQEVDMREEKWFHGPISRAQVGWNVNGFKNFLLLQIYLCAWMELILADRILSIALLDILKL